MTISVGVDVGGTFTDFLMLDSASGAFATAKVPTTVDDRAKGFLQGLAELGVSPAEVGWLVHGTTAGTNAVLERNGARCGLITTQGFGDVLELGRRTRPHAYGLSGNFEPLIERRFRREVPERVDAQGRVVTELDEAALRAAVGELIADGVESLAIHFLHSYVNPDHERRAVAIARDLWSNPHVIAGHEIIREVREFERGSTAAIHASIAPIVSQYITRVADRLRDGGFANELLIMQANGGMMSSRLIGDHAAHTVMSGPAGGVLAAAQIARASGFDKIITGDMGGTSFDVALVVGGEPVITAEKDLAYSVPIRIPMIDMHTVGAGGGSLARIDKAGMLRIGPQSAGSFPGPIGFDRGGDKVTITDANFLLGRLNPQAITGSDKPAPLERIRAAMRADIGDPLGLDADRAASAIVDVAVADMAGAIRLISIEKGHDPRDFALMPFGGAGPLHAVAIARELGLPRVLVPRFPGLTSALGCVMADVRHDFVQTVNQPLRDIDCAGIDAIMADQRERGRALLQDEKVEVTSIELQHEADLLFKGQSHVLRIPLSGETFSPDAALEAFKRAFKTRFDLELPEMIPVLVNMRTTIIGRREKTDLAIFRPASGTLEDARTGSRQVYFNGVWHDTQVYARDALPAGGRIVGPAIVEQADSTLVLDPGTVSQVDDIGNIIVEIDAV
ncbi:N-methylhydantoinase A [Roseovarius pacificus]|uniref:N-methylhydantoinase A n=1 Tax=Roseovarius pacificus TaxID=337701 RepID=A0A1M6Y831_9RHOB|nr:hydantoinase/oxoprolinase family protein [Roseovarius pacificus]GGO51222.1 hydantoinase [Roseovarius pacificus]SHL14333.1 N-methylhydantoinase A [Roseovarius pacificus]